jgi:Flp pilus assembly protein TadD
MCRAEVRSNQTNVALLRPFVAVAPVALAALLLGACANMPKIGEPFSVAEAKPDHAEEGAKPQQTELQRALHYWGQQNAKSPRDLPAAINYAKNLKAAGQMDTALGVLQGASIYHGADRTLASEYGKLALEMGQTSLAQRLLEAADDPVKPDWKIISARGTAHAKQGQYKQAIPLYERALLLSANQPSVISNLAMAHAADGEAPRAEAMLRKIAEGPNADPKIRQNLALVLSLQGKYDEARAISAKDVPSGDASANVEYVRQMVRVEPQAAPKSAPAIGPGVWVTNVATGSIVRAPSNGIRPSQR